MLKVVVFAVLAFYIQGGGKTGAHKHFRVFTNATPLSMSSRSHMCLLTASCVSFLGDLL